MPDRNLTDADVNAIVEALKDSIRQEFYTDLGRGLWSYVKRAVFVVLIGIAAYGAYRSGK